jgi:hypothetical protein
MSWNHSLAASSEHPRVRCSPTSQHLQPRTHHLRLPEQVYSQHQVLSRPLLFAFSRRIRCASCKASPLDSVNMEADGPQQLPACTPAPEMTDEELKGVFAVFTVRFNNGGGRDHIAFTAYLQGYSCIAEMVQHCLGERHVGCFKTWSLLHDQPTP